MEELLEMILKAKKARDKDVEKNFRTARELGIRKGDAIFYKDGEITCVDDADDLLVRYNNIDEVRRPISWENEKVIKPKRKKKGDN